MNIKEYKPKYIKTYNNKAFTLVELIVAIIILAILGTIAFISLQGYSKTARDSTRISDLSSMKSSLELFQLDAGKYPLPTGGTDITYSGGLVWNQGIFGEGVFTNVESLDKIPLDPTTESYYTYSVTSNRSEYELGGVLEGGGIVHNKSLNQTNAGDINASAIVTGNYNGLMTKTLSGTTCNVLAIPTIIANDIETSPDLVEIVTNDRLVYNGHKNLPATFKTSKFKHDGGFNFNPNNLLAYTDTGSCSDLASKTDYTARINLLKGLQDSYSGTILASDGNYRELLTTEINVSTPSITAKNLAGSYLNNAFSYDIEIVKSSGTSSQNTPTVPFSVPDTLTEMFGINTAWTSNWDTNPCDGNMSVVNIAPGNNTIPQNLLSNTIYKLEAGNYTTTYKINLNNCSGLVGVENSTKIIPTGTFSDSIYSYNNSYVIIHGLIVDGSNNPSTGNLISLNIAKMNSLTKLKVINSSGNGLWVNSYSSSTGLWYQAENFISDIIIYNNDREGLVLYGTRNNILNNIHSFNNGYNGIYRHAGTVENNRTYNNTINNTVVYNNSRAGYETALGGFDQLLNNISTYNNWWGIYLVNDYNLVLSNFTAFDNGGEGINMNFDGRNIKYYNFLKSISNNESNSTYSEIYNPSYMSAGISTDTKIADLGFQDGTTPFTSHYGKTFPNTAGWNTTAFQRQTGLTFDGTECFDFLGDLPLQTRPIKWNPTSLKFEYFGTDGVHYDSSKKIAQWAECN